MSLTHITPISINPAQLVGGMISVGAAAIQSAAAFVPATTQAFTTTSAQISVATRLQGAAVPRDKRLDMPDVADVAAINAAPLPPYLKNVQTGLLPKLLQEIDFGKISKMDEADFVYAVISKMPEFLGLANLETTDFKDLKIGSDKFETVYEVGTKPGGAKLPTMTKPIVYGGKPPFSEQMVDVTKAQGFDKAVQKVLTIFWALKGDTKKLTASGLSPENATSFSDYVKSTIQTPADLVQMVYLSIAADFGKTALVVSEDINKLFGADANHLTAMAYFLRNPKLANSSPGFRAMQNPEQQLETLQILFAEAMGLNLGQGANGENVAVHWKIAEQLDLGAIKKLAALYLIKLSGAIGNKDGVGIIQNQLYTMFALQLDALIKLKTGHYATSEEAFNAFKGAAAGLLGYQLDGTENDAKIVTITSLAQISKDMTPEGALKIEAALDGLNESDRQIVISAFSNDGVNGPVPLLYLFPTMIGVAKKAYTENGKQEDFYSSYLKTLVRVLRAANENVIKDSDSGVHLVRAQPLQDAFNGKTTAEVISIFENASVGVRPGIFASEFFWEGI